jgi:hypothetical protein
MFMRMNAFMKMNAQAGWLFVVGCVLTGAAPIQAAEFTFHQETNGLAIKCGDQPVATYFFRDNRIARPFFANLHSPGGIRLTRNHPPKSGVDSMDHNDMHPGLWLAFGDISGQDFWRNLAVIKHERFTAPPAVRDGQLTFATENHLLTTNGQILGTQISRITLTLRPEGYLLIWEATFAADNQDIVFGDQEEMGLGVRVATAITEKNGGVILSSTGAKGAKATWGKAFDWCDYSGVIAGQRAGLTLMPDPANFRPSWFHNRDYGLMVANPFGRKAMKRGEASQVTVSKGETFRLRFGVLLHASPPDQDLNLSEAYRQFLDRKQASSLLR